MRERERERERGRVCKRYRGHENFEKSCFPNESWNKKKKKHFKKKDGRSVQYFENKHIFYLTAQRERANMKTFLQSSFKTFF